MMEIEEKSEIMKKFELMWTILMNIESCLEAIQNGTSPSQRRKFTNPCNLVLKHENRPCAEDFGIFNDRLANVHEVFAKASKELAVMWTEEGTDPRKKQLNQDEMKLFMESQTYFADLTSIYSCVLVPLNSAPPRFLSYRINPTANRNNRG